MCVGVDVVACVRLMADCADVFMRRPVGAQNVGALVLDVGVDVLCVREVGVRASMFVHSVLTRWCADVC